MFLEKPDSVEADDAAKDAVLKVKLLTDFLFFTRWFFKKVYGKKFIVAPHHLAIAAALYKVVTGECKRLIINIPPRYGKTELAVKMFLAWVLANNPRAKSIHLSYSGDLALDNSSAVRDIVKSDEFQRLFPMQIRTDSDSKKKWYNEEGGGLYSTAAGGAITGFGAGSIGREYTGTESPADGFGGVILIDDPLKPDDAFSEAEREKINRRFNNTIASRTNSKDTPIVVIMQRLHEEDLCGFLLDGGSGEEWEHLCLPAITEEGESMWPEKLTIERLRQMEAADPYTFGGQYMQSPAPVGGGNFKDEWWKYYKIAPKTLWRIIFADTAQKTKEHNDFSVFQCWGYSPDYGIILLDQIRHKWEAPELLKQAEMFWKKHRAVVGMGTLRVMKIEDKASGTGLIQSLPKRGIPVQAIQRNIDKVVRAYDAAPWIESGQVWIPEDAEWVSAYVHEFSAFPNGKHDDQIDPTMDAIEDILGGVDMSFIPSEKVCAAIAAGSGSYAGDDPLICGVYVAKDATEMSYIQFRRGKDAMSEQVYQIGWDKSSDPVKIVGLLSMLSERHRPDMMFIGEAGAGLITDGMLNLGHNVIRVNMQDKATAELQYNDKRSEMYWAMRMWIIDDGSLTPNPDLEQGLMSIEYNYDNNDRLDITTGTEWCSALALTFAFAVPKRDIPRGELDSGIGMREKLHLKEYDPMESMDDYIDY